VNLRHGFADSELGQIHYVEAGEGPVLVLLPHGGRSARMYQRLMPLLARQRRIIAFDIPGTGYSATPARAYGIPELAKFVVQAIDSMGIGRFALYGMNGGNKIGSAIAAAYPERVTAFIFAGLTHSIVLSKARRERTLGEHPQVQKILGAAVGAEVPTDWVDQLAEATAVDAKVTEDPYDTVGLVVERLQSFLYRPRFYQATIAFDLEKALRRVRSPLFVLEFATRQEDAEIGRQAASIATELNATAHAVMELAPQGLLSLEDRAQDLASVIGGFLDRSGGPTRTRRVRRRDGGGRGKYLL